MLRIYSCIVHDHDYRLVLVAGVICLLASLTAFSILEQARSRAAGRSAWLALAAFVPAPASGRPISSQCSPYQPDVPIAYDPALTLLSIAAAILITGAGWWTVLRGTPRSALAGGAIVGVGIGTMHYIGMSAANVGGLIVWDRKFRDCLGPDRSHAQRRRGRRESQETRPDFPGAPPCSLLLPYAASTSRRWRPPESIRPDREMPGELIAAEPSPWR